MCLTKSEWLLISKFFLLLAYCLQNPPANGKEGQVLEEIVSKPTKCRPLILLSQPNFTFIEELCLFPWKTRGAP
jgi:hypothetical protein